MREKIAKFKENLFIRIAAMAELICLVLMFIQKFLLNDQTERVITFFWAYHIVALIISLVAIFDRKIEAKLEKENDAKDLERVKEEFALKEGELVEVLFTPNYEEFTMRLSLGIQKKVKTRYFALLEGETISIIPMVGGGMLEPEKMSFPNTLEANFIPMSKKDEDE